MFPVKIKAAPDEDFLGFASRIAAANGFPDLDFMAEMIGVSKRDLAAGSAHAVEALEASVGSQSHTIWKDRRPSAGGLRWTLGAAMFSKEMRPGKTLRFCPACVRDDVEEGAGRPVSRPYRRLAWCTRAVENCHRHMTPIVSVDTDTKYPDFARLLEHGPFRCEAPLPAVVTSCELDMYVEGRIAGRGNGTFLDGIEVFVVAEFSKLFGTFLRRHGWSGPLSCDYSDASDRELGYAIACNGLDRIREIVIDVLKSKRPVPREIRKFFEPLRRWLRRNRDRGEFQTLAHFVQDIVEENAPVGPGECFIFDVERRRVHTAKTASVEFGIPADRIIDLVQNAGLGFGPSTSAARTYFDAEAARSILVEASATLTSADVRMDLGIHESRVRDLLEQGLIERVEVREGSRVYSRIRPSELEAFKDRLFRPAKPVEAVENGWENALAISQKCKVRLADLLRTLSRDPTIERRLLPGRPSLHGLLLNRSAMVSVLVSVRDAMQKEQALPTQYLSLDEVRARLKTTDGTVAELISRKLIAVRSRRHLRLGRRYRTVDLEELERFEATYISLHNMSRNSGIQIAELKSQLDRARIRSVYTPRGKIARYYRRQDLAKDHIFNHVL
jgi:hypothetical protein